jgi:hypothetical protein
MTKYYVSCEKFTCLVETNEYDTIIETAPILQKFVGQNLNNLTDWMNKKFSDTEILNLKDQKS